MFIKQHVSMQGKYKLTSRDLSTNEVTDQSGWSDNNIMRTPEAAKIIHETGFTSTPPFLVGRTDTNNFVSFENIINLTHTTRTMKTIQYGWITPGNPAAGYYVIGGGSYKFLPQTTTRGLKVNQVGIDKFSIAQIKNEDGIAMSYPITPNVEIEVDFELSIAVKPEQATTIPTLDLAGLQLFVTPCKINVAIDDAMIKASGYEWTQLLTRADTGLTAYSTVAGSITDPNVIGKMPPTANMWEGLRGWVHPTVPGDYIRQGYISSGRVDFNYVRLGIPVGIPGIYTSVIFGSLYNFPRRTLTNINVNSSYNS